MIKITKYNYDIVSCYIKTKNVKKTAKFFNIPPEKVYKINNRVRWLLARNDREMRIIFNTYLTFDAGFKRYPKEIENCFFKIINQKKLIDQLKQQEYNSNLGIGELSE